MACWKIFTFIFSLVLGYTLWDNFEPERIKGKRVLITGASTGIGEQLAYTYAKFGADVLITARNEARLKEVVDKCKQLGTHDGTFSYIAADMGIVEDYKRVVEAAKQRMGGLDILVLNHIVVVPFGEWLGTSSNFTLLQKTMDINFRAYVHVASHALPLLEMTTGSIVVISSVAGKVAQPYVASYSASKFALDGYFGGLRQELLLRNSPVSITVAVIGLISTDNAMKKLKDFGADFLLKTVPTSSPNECALAIVKGGELRAREIYFPYLEARLSTLLRDWFPGVLQWFVRFLYGKE